MYTKTLYTIHSHFLNSSQHFLCSLLVSQSLWLAPLDLICPMGWRWDPQCQHLLFRKILACALTPDLNFPTQLEALHFRVAALVPTSTLPARNMMYSWGTSSRCQPLYFPKSNWGITCGSGRGCQSLNRRAKIKKNKRQK